VNHAAALGLNHVFTQGKHEGQIAQGVNNDKQGDEGEDEVL